MLWPVLALIVAVVTTVLAEHRPASAHTPFVAESKKIVLPSGRVGEIRLLHGDGIIGPNPIRALIVDDEGRLLARSHQSTTMTLICSGDQQCRAVDVRGGHVLEFDPSTFREGPKVPYYGDELWAIETGEESWGFSVRHASSAERLQGELALAERELPLLVFLFVMGALGGAMVFRRHSERSLLNGLGVLQILAGLTLLLFAIGASVLGILVTNSVLLLGSIVAGASASVLLRYLCQVLLVRPQRG